MSRGNTNRQKGHNAERYYAKIFKDLGFTFCVTSRYGSKLVDDAGIDLLNLPINVQIKAGKQTSMNPGRELLNMSLKVKEFFPPEDPIHSKPGFLIHKKPVGRGKKPLPEHQIVYMSVKQFLKFKESDSSLIPLFDKEYKFKIHEDSEFKSLVAITFEVFVEKIIKKFYI